MFKHKINKEKGITLIALVVTIIVLLLLAGISIQMLTGNNGILQRAGEAKTLTDIAEEKEILQISVLSTIGKEKYGNISKEELDAELDKNIGSTNYSSELAVDGISITFTKSGRTYIVDDYGNIEKKVPSIKITDSKVVINSNGTGEDVTANSKTEGTDTLYISFVPIIAGGNIISVTYDGNTIMPQNGTYVLEVSKNGDYVFSIIGTLEGELISTSYTKLVDKYSLRSGINIGDYVTYIAPTRENYELLTTVSGYSSVQTLGQEYAIWRVLNINNDGSVELLPIITSNNKTICLFGHLGYNNAVWVLDDICSYLYENGLEITSRSIDMEDITKYMIDGVEEENLSNCTGIKKILKYQKNEIENLTLNSNYAIAKNTIENLVTYKRAKLYYPDIYEHQEGMGINIYSESEERYIGNVQKKGDSGVIGESDKYYEEPTINNSNNTTKNLTTKYTYYDGKINEIDFDNKQIYSMIFGMTARYWLASRYVECSTSDAYFGIRYVDDSGLKGNKIATTYSGMFSQSKYSICPIITIKPNVQIIKCDGINSSSNTHTILMPN